MVSIKIFFAQHKIDVSKKMMGLIFLKALSPKKELYQSKVCMIVVRDWRKNIRPNSNLSIFAMNKLDEVY